MPDKLFRSLPAEIRRMLTISSLGALCCWLASLGDILFVGKLSFKEALASLFLFLAASLMISLPLYILAEVSSRLDGRLVRFRLPVTVFITLAAVYPLACLLITRRSWTYEFLGVALLITVVIFPLFYFIWKHVQLKALWLLATLFSTWFFYSVVENEGLLMRAGVELLDLPTLVLFVIAFAVAATSVLLARFAASLRNEKPYIIEATLLLGGGLLLTVFADDVIDVHYENIFRVTVFFAFVAMLHGLSVIPRSLPFKISMPLVALVLLAGVLLAIPFDGKPSVLSLKNPVLAQKNRSVSEMLKLSGLAEGEQRVAVCRLHKLADYPEGKFARRFEASLNTARHRPEAEELNADPQRRIIDPEKPWNFLFISIDSLRYDKTSYSGLFKSSKTPAMEKLAEKSQRYHRAYPQGGWTSLSIPALLWSKFPTQIDFTPVYEDRNLKLYLPDELSDKVQIRREYQVPLAEKDPNMAAVLSENGFLTVSVTNDGRTGFFDPRLGLTRGFTAINYAGEDGHDTKVLEMAQTALKSMQDRRFFMWVHFFDVHGCHKKPDDKKERKKWDSYDYRVGLADQKVGVLLDLLKEQGLDDRTVVILTGDHGQSMGELGVRGHGLGLNEASIHVPLLIRIPGLKAADYARPVGLVDLAPTILDLAGLGDRVPQSWVGTSLAPMLAAGRDLDHPPVIVETWRNKVNKRKKYLRFSGVYYEDSKVTIQFDDMNLSLYGKISPKTTREKLLSTELKAGEMSAEQLYMTKYMLDRNQSLMKQKCR